MKHKKNYLVISGIIILLVLAYLLPTLISILEDRHLRFQSKKFQIEEITLNPGNGGLSEKLSSIQTVLQDGVVMQEGEIETLKRESEMEEIVLSFLSDILSLTETKFIKFAATSLVLTDKGANKVYSLWKCRAVNRDKQKYVFYVDDETKKILAFEIPYFTGETDKEQYHELAHMLAEYYGYTGVEMEGDLSEFLKKSSKDNSVKYLYQENALRFFHENEETDVELMFYKSGELLSFNMYPSQISVEYHSSDKN